MLASLSDILHRIDPEGRLDASTIDALLDEINNLCNDVISAEDVDDDLRALILKHLREAEQALQLYRIYGPGRLDEVFGAAFSDAARKSSKWSDPASQGWLRKFMTFIGKLPTLVKHADQVVQLVEHAKNVLESGPGQ
ncbi:MAG TPA: hypothetical protein VGH72_04715, partial [Pseudonocardia sp.]